MEGADDMDVDVDASGIHSPYEPAAGGEGPQGGAWDDDMDWVETPSYWGSWEAEGQGRSSGEYEYRSQGDPRQGQAHTFYLVVDTNILVESLESLELLCTCETCHLVVCVPWIVLCELDGLKAKKRAVTRGADADDLHKRAHSAMKYLETAFTSAQGRSRCVQFLGQSMQEFRKAIEDYGVKGVRHSNDDLILQCTLQKHKMMLLQRDRGGESRHVILLTNDRNLCLKTAACGLRALPLDALLADFDRTLSLVVEESAASQPSVAGEPASTPPREKKPVAREDLDARDLSQQLLQVVLSGVSLFIEGQFRENFGEKEWKSMVAVPPPWTLEDLFKLMKQHWFSLDLDREVQEIMDLVEHVHGKLKKQQGQQKEGAAPNAVVEVVPKQTFLMFFEKSERLFALLSPSSAELGQQKLQLNQMRQQVYQR